MSTGMPELGSKISLISKADIRYEGRLFTVDPQECTIALSNVRSFGTEERNAPFPVLPQSQVYDYILFRGSDIKDIRVVQNSNPIPNDPAIVTLSVPPPLATPGGFQQASAPQPPQQQQSAGDAFAHGLMGHLGASSQFGNFSGNVASGLAPGMRIGQESRTLSNLIGGGRSGAATPVSGVTRKSPTMDQGIQTNNPGAVGSRPQRIQQQQQPRGPTNRTFSGDRDQRDNRRSVRNQGAWIENSWQRQGQMQNQNQQQQNQDGWGNNRGGWRGGQRRGRARGGNIGQPRGALGQGPVMRGPQQQSTGPSPGQKKNVLKFEGDYDFEQANTEFENLKSQLANVKLTATASGQLPIATAETVATTAKVNGEDKKEVDSGNETGVGEGEAEEDSEVFYDKTKSFFDNISCEAVERSKGASQRKDWRQERKLNSETFGVASARRGYRGRGYYRGGSTGGMYRGGFRGGFRGRGNFNNRNNGIGAPPQQGGQNRATAAPGGK